MKWLSTFLIALGFSGSAAWAEGAIPENRFVFSRNLDFYGADIQPLFDTTLEACQTLCRTNPDCQAFTFNRNKNACFPKRSVGRAEAFEGALSARLVQTDQRSIDLARLRVSELSFLSTDDLKQAHAQADFLGQRHGGGQWTADELLGSSQTAEANGNLPNAIHWTGGALAQSDLAWHWMRYAELSALHAASLSGSNQRKFQRRARLALINAYLRSDQEGQRVTILYRLAEALEQNGQGRQMIPALRLAHDLQPRPEISELLDQAIGKYGFRVVAHSVESDLGQPRLCAEFSEPLIRTGTDYTPFVQLPDPRLVVQSDDRKVCVSGVRHGERYSVTFRSGLPAQNGEKLVRNVEISAYIRDRSPSVSFPGRTYVLPKTATAGLPVETVNVDQLSLSLSRVSDRNLLATLRDGYFGRPLGEYDIDYFESAMGEPIWSGSAEIQGALNKEATTLLPMQEALGDLPAGVYVLSARVPDARDTDKSRATQWFVLSDLGLTTLQGTDGLHVFVRGLGNAQPLDGVEVSLVSESNRVLDRQRSDAQGHVLFAPALMNGANSARAAMVAAQQGDEDFSFLSLREPAFDLSDRGVEGRDPAGPMDLFVTTDRGAYRAGETIHATALLRDSRAKAIDNVPLIAVLTRPDGVEYSRHISDGGQAGGHVFHLPTGADVQRGTWRLEMFADPKGAALAKANLLVEDFVPEKIDFDLSLPDAPINPLAPPVLDLTARYLFGAPGADLEVEGEISLATTRTLEAFPGYQFGRHDDQRDVRVDSLDPMRTGNDGTVALPLILPEMDPQGRPMRADIRMRLSEASGRPVERGVTRAVAPTGPIIGIRPAFDGGLPEGAEAQFDLIAIGPDLSPQTLDVTWQINRLRTRYQWYSQYGNWNWEPITTRELVAQGQSSLGVDPFTVSADVTWGEYELVVARVGGDYLASSVTFDAGWYAPADTSKSPDLLDMSLDKERYQQGDTARLRVVPRYAGKALVTVLSDHMVAMQAVDLPEGESVVDLPVTEEWGAGVYVTAQMLRPMDVAQGRNPARALGIRHAAVDPGEAQLAVNLTHDAELQPRGPLKVRAQVDGLNGQPGYVTLAAVDLGILNLTGFQSPDPSQHFFGQRRLGVEIRDLYGRLIDGMSGTPGVIRSGGDGGAHMRMQSPPPTEKLVAFFSGPIAVDAQGNAELSFDLPDFNGTVRLMAVAWSADAVGQAESDVLVRDPVVISAALPRFLAPGDSSRLLLDLTHASGPAGEMPLRVSVDGLEADMGALPQSIELETGGKSTIHLPLVAKEVGDHKLMVSLTTPDGQVLTKDLTLGVRANDPQISETRRLSLAPGQALTLDDALFADMRKDSGHALISAGPIAQLDAPGLLSALDRYPYGCTEQVTSQAMPLLHLSGLAESLGLGNKAQLDLRVRQAIDKLLTRQADNGSFGPWNAYSGETWLSAYVTDFLGRARGTGYDVPDRAFESALDNLQNRISYASDFDRGGEDLAYALMVLAREGRAAMGDLRYYSDEKGADFGSPLAQAQMGLALASYGDQPRADRLFGLAQAQLDAGSEEGQTYRADYGSSLRDAAGVLALALEARSERVDQTQLVQRVVQANGRLSTQEQSWALMAVRAMSQKPAKLGLRLDGKPFGGALTQRFEQASAPKVLKNTGAQPVDITLSSFGVSAGQTGESGYGYRLTRAYFLMDGTAVSGPIPVGTRMVAVLTVHPANAVRARLMIDDPLPAGFEIDNPTLLRSGDIRALDWLKPHDTVHSEFRAERFLAAVDQDGGSPIQVAYVLRAVTPGSYHHPAAQVEDMYRPDFRATTASGQVAVTP